MLANSPIIIIIKSPILLVRLFCQTDLSIRGKPVLFWVILHGISSKWDTRHEAKKCLHSQNKCCALRCSHWWNPWFSFGVGVVATFYALYLKSLTNRCKTMIDLLFLVPSSGTLFPPGYGIWRLTFKMSNNNQYLWSVWSYQTFCTSWKRLEAVGILCYINMWHYLFIITGSCVVISDWLVNTSSSA